MAEILIDGVNSEEFNLNEDEILFLYETVESLDKYDIEFVRKVLVKLHCEAFGLMESLDFIKEHWHGDDEDEL